VTFSLQPYSEALAIGDFQNQIMEEILKIENIEEKWNSQEVENLILSKLKSEN
jgi:kynurenine 3-monooxygenase